MSRCWDVANLRHQAKLYLIGIKAQSCNKTCLLVLRQLLEYSVWLLGVRTPNSHQKTLGVREHRLNLVVCQDSQVLWVDERVTATVQSHLTVHLNTRFIILDRVLDVLICLPLPQAGWLQTKPLLGNNNIIK